MLLVVVEVFLNKKNKWSIGEKEKTERREGWKRRNGGWEGGSGEDKSFWHKGRRNGRGKDGRERGEYGGKRGERGLYHVFFGSLVGWLVRVNISATTQEGEIEEREEKGGGDHHVCFGIVRWLVGATLVEDEYFWYNPG
jgi:hypothetical protein